MLDVYPIHIGDFTLFGPSGADLHALHPLNAEARRREEYGKPVVIGSDVWVGGGATRDVPAGVFAAGNPCRVMRAIANE